MMKRIFKYKLTLNAMLLFFKAQSVAFKQFTVQGY